MSATVATQEDFTAAKYALQNVTFRSIKRARDIFLAEHAVIAPKHEERYFCLSMFFFFGKGGVEAPMLLLLLTISWLLPLMFMLFLLLILLLFMSGFPLLPIVDW
jgi:hypothetical protein